MMDKYKEETASVHAPLDLILKTKEAVREEEVKYRQEQNVTETKQQEQKELVKEQQDEKVIDIRSRSSKKKSFYVAVTAVAAVVLIIMAGRTYRITGEEDINKMATGGTEQVNTEIVIDEQPFEVEVLEDESDLPKEFEEAELVQTDTISYRAIYPEDGGTKVAVLKDGKYSIFTFDSTKLDLIIPMIESYLE